MSPGHQNHRTILGSWKEIANYLNRSVRTCVRWEKELGLPLRRLGKSGRSGIIAYTDELDRWLDGTFKNAQTLRSEVPGIRGAKKAATLSAVIIIVTCGLWLFFKSLQDRTPADFKIQGTVLMVLNEEGKELWRFDTKRDNLWDEASFKGRFQRRQMPDHQGQLCLPLLMFRDINADGRIETLFNPQTIDEYGGNELYCFNQKGRKLWRKRFGRSLTYGNRSFPPDFVIDGFDVFDLDGDGKQEICCISNAVHEWPTQLTILSSDGRQTGEYWNAGHLDDMVFADVDEDGKPEIICAGLNNEYEKGCLVVFDPEKVAGGSPQVAEGFRCRELKKGTQSCYILFPRTDVDRAKWSVEAMINIEITSDGRLKVSALQSGLTYEFSKGLRPPTVFFTHGFIQQHREFKATGKIGSELNVEYRQAIENGVLYYDGENWIHPAPDFQPFKASGK